MTTALESLESAKGNIDGVCRRLAFLAQRLTELDQFISNKSAKEMLKLNVESILLEIESLGRKT